MSCGGGEGSGKAWESLEKRSSVEEAEERERERRERGRRSGLWEWGRRWWRWRERTVGLGREGLTQVGLGLVGG